MRIEISSVESNTQISTADQIYRVIAAVHRCMHNVYTHVSLYNPLQQKKSHFKIIKYTTNKSISYPPIINLYMQYILVSKKIYYINYVNSNIPIGCAASPRLGFKSYLQHLLDRKSVV